MVASIIDNLWLRIGLGWADKKRQLYAGFLTLLGLLVLASRLYISVTRPILFLDESLYLAEAVAVVQEGKFPPFSWNPGVALAHSVSYLILQDIPLGVDYAGRVTSFIAGCALYVVIFLVVKELVGRLWALASVGIALSGYPLWIIDRNSSDLLYALIVMMVIFLIAKPEPGESGKQKRFLFFLAALLLLSTTVRNDGLVLYVVMTLIIFAWLIYSPQGVLGKVHLFLLCWLLPLLVMISILALVYHIQGGGFNAWVWRVTEGNSLSARTYLAFEQGEGWARRFEMQVQGKSPWSDGRQVARELYGSPEENQHSVWRAILRNPEAWLRRVGWNFRDFFLSWHEAYKGRGLAIFVLSILGYIELTSRHRRLGIVIASILTPTLAYFFLTFWIYRYVLILSPIWAVLSVCALHALTGSHPSLSPRVSLAAACVSGIAGLVFVWEVAANSAHLNAGIHWGDLVVGPLIWVLFVTYSTSRTVWLQDLRKAVALLLLGILGVVSFAGFPPLTSTHQTDYREYIRFASNNFKGVDVCVRTEDLTSSSLVWYARQRLVYPLVSVRLTDVRESNRISRILEERGCNYFLWTGNDLKDLLSVPALDPLYVSHNRYVGFFRHRPVSAAQGVGEAVELENVEEVVLADFQDSAELDNWFAHNSNNVQGSFHIANGYLQLSYINNQARRDVFAYIFALPQPAPAVQSLQFHARIQPGTYLTIDVKVEGQWVSPRFVSYYPGAGIWETISVPVNGQLDAVAVSIGEKSESGITEEYRVDLDWIKAVVHDTREKK